MADYFLPIIIHVKLDSYCNKSDFAMLLFWSHSKTSVIVLSRIVEAAEDIDGVAARGDTTEVAEVGKVGRKTIIVDKLLVVGQILLLL